MMVKFGRIVWRVMLIFGALLVSSHVMGSAKITYAQLLFTTPSGMICEQPCLLGVQPGKTRIDDAIEIIKQHPLTHDFQQSVYFYKTSQSPKVIFRDQGISVMVYSDDSNLVNHIDILRIPSRVLARNWGVLGDIVAVLGQPNLVDVCGQMTTLTVYTFEHLLFSHARQQQDRQTVQDDFDSVTAYIDQLDFRQYIPWSHFGNVKCQHVQIRNYSPY